MENLLHLGSIVLKECWMQKSGVPKWLGPCAAKRAQKEDLLRTRTQVIAP
jgi:hypothetical protein